MKKLYVLLVLMVATSLFAFDMPKKPASVSGAATSVNQNTDIAGQALTKSLKSVQNEKGPIIFQSGKAVLDVAKCKTTLDAVKSIVLKTPGYIVTVEGHTDSVGNADANMALSLQRAQAVVTYLVQNGVAADRLKAKGYGGTVPIADNKTAAGQAKNRRVDFAVSKK